MTRSQGNSDQKSKEQTPIAESSRLASLLGASTFMFACRVLGAGLAFLTQLLQARWMGAHELGIYLYAFSWCIILDYCWYGL